MKVFCYNGDEFSEIMRFEGWKLGILRYGPRFKEFNALERHLLTDEAFVLLDGAATLYEDGIEPCIMEKCKVYCIEKGMWHHITLSPDACVLVIENSNTTKENTERKYLYYNK